MKLCPFIAVWPLGLSWVAIQLNYNIKHNFSTCLGPNRQYLRRSAITHNQRERFISSDCHPVGEIVSKKNYDDSSVKRIWLPVLVVQICISRKKKLKLLFPELSASTEDLKLVSETVLHVKEKSCVTVQRVWHSGLAVLVWQGYEWWVKWSDEHLSAEALCWREVMNITS